MMPYDTWLEQGPGGPYDDPPDSAWEEEADRRHRASRTNRLMWAIEQTEVHIESLRETDPILPHLREKLTNLTGALLTHRRLERN